MERTLILKYRPPANTEFLDPEHEKKKQWFIKKNLQQSGSHQGPQKWNRHR